MNVPPALGDFDEPQRSSLTMFGVLSIAVRIYQDRWGYGIYSGPIGSAVFIITVKWVRGVLQSNYQSSHSVLNGPFSGPAVSASEDEAAESGVSGEDGVHAAGRPRLLLRRSGSDAAFLFRGNNRNQCLIHIVTPPPPATVFLNYS